MCWLPEQKSWMEHGKRPDLSAGLTLIGKPRAPRTHNPSLDAQKRASCGAPKANQEFRIGEVNLALNERQTYLCFLESRRPVAWGSPRNHVRDVHILSI